MRVRLTVKLADLVNGIDLSRCAEGDVIDLAESDASLLIMEGWAEQVLDEKRVSYVPFDRAEAADQQRKP